MKNLFNCILLALLSSLLFGCGESSSVSNSRKQEKIEDTTSGPLQPSTDPKGLNAFFAKLLTEKAVLTATLKADAPIALYTTNAASANSNFPGGAYTLKFDSPTALNSFTIPGRILAYGDDQAHIVAPTGDGVSLTTAQLANIAMVSVNQTAGTFNIDLVKAHATLAAPTNSDVVVSPLAAITDDPTMNAASGSRKLHFTVDSYESGTRSGTGKVFVYLTSGARAAAANRGTTTPFAPPVQIDVTYSFPAS